MDKTKNTSNISGGVTAKKLTEWKKEGSVKKIQVKVSETDLAIGYLREPKREEYGLAAQIYEKKGLLGAGEFLLNNCWLGGDKRIQEIDKIYISAAMQAQTLVSFLESSISEV